MSVFVPISLTVPEGVGGGGLVLRGGWVGGRREVRNQPWGLMRPEPNLISRVNQPNSPLSSTGHHLNSVDPFPSLPLSPQAPALSQPARSPTPTVDIWLTDPPQPYQFG